MDPSRGALFGLPDIAMEPIQEQVRKMAMAAAIADIRAWERATLEAAHDAGFDVRTPFGPELIAFAQTSYTVWTSQRPDPWPTVTPWSRHGQA